MNPLRTFCLVACLLATVCASSSSSHQQSQNHMRRNSLNNNLKPTEWLSVSELENLPAVDQVSLQQLEQMSVDEGADLVNKLYHLAQIETELTPSFAPNPSEIPAYIIAQNGQKVNFNLNQLVANANQQPNFGAQELTIFITGLPESTQTVAKANRRLERAYMRRYNIQRDDYNNDNSDRSSPNSNTGTFVGIELGNTITSYERYATLDVEEVGQSIGNVLVGLNSIPNVIPESIHLVAQGIACHVAGAAANEFSLQTGNDLRRITCLDPSKIVAKSPNTMPGLARGDAEFVDAIHTSAQGMGTTTRAGDVDFYANDPSVGAPGADNIVEASMLATNIFAESVRPGNERNFPAERASSYRQFKSNNGYGKRAYMGIDAAYDVEGDYFLKVNAKSPYRTSAPAQKRNNYHSHQQSWNKAKSQDY